eukprot:GFYU01005730.1.p2 GENE.GFYU01005730.1~~GFYU01005730.1.p2  ORF type:complete len:130 (-),score=57.90 GFYU01005730.1:211-600(-)
MGYGDEKAEQKSQQKATPAAEADSEDARIRAIEKKTEEALKAMKVNSDVQTEKMQQMMHREMDKEDNMKKELEKLKAENAKLKSHSDEGHSDEGHSENKPGLIANPNTKHLHHLRRESSKKHNYVQVQA